MSTIAEMVVRLTGDNSALRSTFADSAQLTARFGNDLKRITDQLATRPVELKLRTEQAEAKLAEVKQKLDAVNAIAARGGAGPGASGSLTASAQAEYSAMARNLNVVLASVRRDLSDLRVTSRVEGEKAAMALVESMEEVFNGQQAAIKEALWGGSVTGVQARAMGAVSAIQFNEGIRSAMESLGNASLLTPALEASLNSQMKVVGDAAGVALGTAMRESIEAQAPRIAGGFSLVGREVTNAAGMFTSFGRRGSQALIGLGFGIESFANGTGSGMRRAARAVESFGLMFGGTGLIAAGLITGAVAIYDYFHKAEQRADEAAKKIANTMSQLANTNNQIGLQQQLMDLEKGERTSVVDDKLVTHAPSTIAPGSYEGGYNDLLAKQQKALQALRDAMTGKSSPHLQDQLVNDLRKANADLAPVAEQRRQLMKLASGEGMLPIHEIKPLETKVTGGESGALRDTGAEVEALSAHMDTLLKGGERTAAVYKAIGSDVARLLDIQVALTGEARRTGESFENWGKRLADVQRIGDAVRKTFIVIKDTVDTSHFPDYGAGVKEPPPVLPSPQWQAFDESVARVKVQDMNLQITNAQRRTQGQAQLNPDVVLSANRVDVLEKADAYRKAIMGANIPLQAQAALLEVIIEKLREAGVDANSLLSRFEKMVLALSKAAAVMGALGSLADAAGDRGSAKILGDASNAVNSIGAAAAKGGRDPVADIQAAASVITVVKDMFDSPLQREQLALMRENNRQLAMVSLRLAGFQASAAGNRTAAGAAAGAALRGTGGAIGALEVVGTLQSQIDVLTPYLKAAGLTWVQFAQIAKDSGFQIFDSMGRIAAGPLAQFAAGMADAVKALFTFSNSFADQLALANINNALNNKTSDADKMAAQLAAIQKTAPNLLPGNFDTGTQEGQNALRDALKALVAAIQAGTIDPANFGGFQNLQELLGAIDPLIQGLNALTASSTAASTALTNVPPTFKYALMAWDATNADPANVSGGIKAVPFKPINEMSTSRPDGSGGSVTFQVGNINFLPDHRVGAGTPAEQANAIVVALRTQALALFGDADRWAEVQPT